MRILTWDPKQGEITCFRSWLQPCSPCPPSQVSLSQGRIYGIAQYREDSGLQHKSSDMSCEILFHFFFFFLYKKFIQSEKLKYESKQITHIPIKLVGDYLSVEL